MSKLPISSAALLGATLLGCQTLVLNSNIASQDTSPLRSPAPRITPSPPSIPFFPTTRPTVGPTLPKSPALSPQPELPTVAPSPPPTTWTSPTASKTTAGRWVVYSSGDQGIFVLGYLDLIEDKETELHGSWYPGGCVSSASDRGFVSYRGWGDLKISYKATSPSMTWSSNAAVNRISGYLWGELREGNSGQFFAERTDESLPILCP